MILGVSELACGRLLDPKWPFCFIRDRPFDLASDCSADSKGLDWGQLLEGGDAMRC